MTATPSARPRLILALLALSQLVTSVDYNIVYVALPVIGARLGLTGPDLQWVVSAYAVTFGGFLLLGGRASDVLGRRRTFALGLALYAGASLAGGLASTAGLLVAARAVQGLGGAFLFPATLALLNTGFPEGAVRNRAFGVWAAAGGGGLILGSLLGGVLTELLGWPWVFFVNVPLCAVGLVGTYLLVAADRPRAVHRRFDVLGAGTGTAGMTLLVFTVVRGPELGWTSPVVLLTSASSVGLLAAFVVIEHRSADPLLPFRLFRHRNLTVGVTLTGAFMATFGTLLYFLTVYFQMVRGYTALRTGLAFGLPVAVMFVGSLSGGQVLTRFGVRATLVVSLFLGATGTALLGATLSVGAGYPALVPGLLLLSAGQGVIFPVMFAAASTGVPDQDQGIASGVVSAGQQLGSAVGLAVLVAIADGGADRLSAHASAAATASGIRTAVVATAVGITAMLALPFAFHRAPTARQHVPERSTSCHSSP